MTDTSIFYTKFPNFDWKFYVDIYEDLKLAGIDSEENAILHYTNHGQFENRRTHQIIKSTNKISYINIDDILKTCNQGYVSDGLHMFKKRLFKKYNLIDYNCLYNSCIFFGIYTDNDLIQISNHKGLKIIIWGGEDVNINNSHSSMTVKEIKNVDNAIHIAISECIQNSLLTFEINSILIYFDLVDYDIFKKTPKHELGKSIFIYNGFNKGREHIYGKNVYEKVIEKLPQFNYIFSNELQIPYEEMYEIYKKCFIGLRLTKHDGNANMVQECKAINIPVVYNFGDYGLKWDNYQDVINHILLLFSP